MRILGYVVFNQQNGPLGLAKHNVLWCDIRVTVFRSRHTAQTAIHRTLQYALDTGVANEPAWKGHFVKPLVEQP